ncbi:hypothetical protein KR009_005548 [Drosophila setifemur]|nr:hypothetical protein KR009_005548 [Drosophila setifemur]
MYGSAFLLLLSALVLSMAVAIPASTEEADYYNEPDYLGSGEERIHKRSADDSSSSSEEPKDIVNKPAAEDSSSSSEEPNDIVNKPAVDDSSRSSEDPNGNVKEEVPTDKRRRRRSAQDERSRNLQLLAWICPERQLEDLEQGSYLEKRLEIYNMYEICNKLPKRNIRKDKVAQFGI